jgi:hypothetical protein
MAGLKSFLPVMAETFGTTADALYNRQRVLARMGLLPSVAGKGPGSGVPLTADSLAVMIIALMAAETLHDVDDRVKGICEAKPDRHASSEETSDYLNLPTFRSAMEYAILEFDRFPLSGFDIQFVSISPFRGQFLLTEYNKRGFDLKKEPKTKTYLVRKSAMSRSGEHSPIVRTSELHFTSFAVRSLMNQFAFATRARNGGVEEEE